MATPLLFVSASELVFILFMVLLLFGAKKIPEIARGLGRGIREFQSASDALKREIADAEQPLKPTDSDLWRNHPHTKGSPPEPPPPRGSPPE